MRDGVLFQGSEGALNIIKNHQQEDANTRTSVFTPSNSSSKPQNRGLHKEIFIRDGAAGLLAIQLGRSLATTRCYSSELRAITGFVSYSRPFYEALGHNGSLILA